MGFGKGSKVIYRDGDGKEFQAVVASEIFMNFILIALDAGDGKPKNVVMVNYQSVRNA